MVIDGKRVKVVPDHLTNSTCSECVFNDLTCKTSPSIYVPCVDLNVEDCHFVAIED